MAYKATTQTIHDQGAETVVSAGAPAFALAVLALCVVVLASLGSPPRTAKVGGRAALAQAQIVGDYPLGP